MLYWYLLSYLLINEFIDNSNISKLDNFVKNLHNADIAEIIQNLDNESRLQFILKIKNYFDPEILTYLNESIRDEIIEQLDIKQLASNASALDVDDAVDVIEDLEESDKEVFLDNISDVKFDIVVVPFSNERPFAKEISKSFTSRDFFLLDSL